MRAVKEKKIRDVFFVFLLSLITFFAMKILSPYISGGVFSFVFIPVIVAAIVENRKFMLFIATIQVPAIVYVSSSHLNQDLERVIFASIPTFIMLVLIGEGLLHYKAIVKKLNTQKDELQKLNNEIKEQQMQLIHKAKLASLGELAAGIAHEINNPLVGVLGFAKLIKNSKNSDVEIVKLANFIVNAGNRIKVITDHIREFSRISSKKDLAIVDISLTFANSLRLYGENLRLDGIELKRKVETHSTMIYAEQHKVESIFLNLLSNSRDAFEINEIENRKIDVIFSQNGEDEIQIAYSDNAGGISEKIINNIFDPFFTTKDTGDGTGLGLSLCYGIIKEYNGSIDVKSTEGVGTTFLIRFPLCKKESPLIEKKEKKAEKDLIDKIPKGMKILVVDDDDTVISFFKSMLKEFNLTAICNPILALEKIEKEKYDLIISDFKMPQINGDRIIEQARKFQSQTPVVIITGHVIGKDLEDLVSLGASAVLNKPFDDINDLFKIIQTSA